jgi:quinol monooxygenase YgiN
MHVILRRFAGAAAQAEEATRRAQQGLVPLLKKQQGFLGYAALASEQGDFVTFSIYEDAAAARRANEEVRGWARECGVLPQTSTETFMGAVWRHALVEPQSGGADQSLYCVIRETENAPADEVMGPLADLVIPEFRKDPGFRGVYMLRSAENPSGMANVLFCRDRESAMRAHELMVGTVRDRMPGTITRVVASGTATVLVMA